MKKDDINIEKLFSTSFDNYQVEPKEETWGKISRKMFARKFFRFNFKSLNVYYVSAFILLVSSVALMLNVDSEKYKTFEISNLQSREQYLKIRQIKLNGEIDAEQSNNYVEPNGNSNKIAKTSSKKYRKTEKNNLIKSKPVETVEFIPNSYARNFVDIAAKSSGVAGLENLKSMPPVPAFNINNRRGCAPLTVKLSNNTKYAQEYEWSFGDGGKSVDANPVYVYNEPGIYTIMMKAKGTGGTVYSFLDSVVVSNKLIYNIRSSLSGQVIEKEDFIVSVEGSESADYRWYFGDGSTSNKRKTTHRYDEAGFYRISLAASNNDNCYDSVVITNAKVVKSPNKLIFPTAFMPNTSGSVSSKYNKNTANNYLFFPLVTGILTDYHIKIYAKTGVVLFETKDVNIAWNGYYKSKLVPEGVYPYVVTAKFAGDDKRTVHKRGNVTVLYKKHP